MTNIEKSVINLIQTNLRISNNIYEQIASELNITINNLFSIIEKYKKNGTIRNISAIINTKQAGYISTLTAFRTDEKNLEAAKNTINAHPGVSHNYLRNNAYNIWFTIALPEEYSLEKEIDYLAQKTKAEDYILLPEIYKLKLRVFTKVSNDQFQPNVENLNNVQTNYPQKLSDLEVEITKIIQKDIPLCKNPFNRLINNSKLNISPDTFFKTVKSLESKNIIRRFSAILNQHAVGYKNNALVTWKTNNQTPAQLKEYCEQFEEISHAYIRKTIPGKWEHPLFTMVHAQTSSQLNSTIEKFKKNSGLKEHLILKSLKEFKKKPIEYFSSSFINLSQRQ